MLSNVGITYYIPMYKSKKCVSNNISHNSLVKLVRKQNEIAFQFVWVHL